MSYSLYILQARAVKFNSLKNGLYIHSFRINSPKKLISGALENTKDLSILNFFLQFVLCSQNRGSLNE